MDIIRKQCPMFNMCSNWDHVKRNLSNINPENINKNNRSNNNIANINVSRPATHTPTTSSHTSHTSHTLHHTTRRGSYHARGIPGQQVPYHANTAPPEELRRPRAAHATCPAATTTTTTPVGRGRQMQVGAVRATGVVVPLAPWENNRHSTHTMRHALQYSKCNK